LLSRLNKANRKADFRRGKRLGADDHIVRWYKPTSIRSLDWQTYKSLPEYLTIREARVRVAQPGFRIKHLVVVTTLLDPQQAAKEDLATLYRARWNNELDLRAIKSTMQMHHLRCKTPERVHKEIWTHILAYNLIRTIIAQAAIKHDCLSRSISFKGASQTLEAFQPLIEIRAAHDAAFRSHYLMPSPSIGSLTVSAPGRAKFSINYNNANKVTLTVSQVLSARYWTGDQDGAWNTNNAGNTNWSDDISGTPDSGSAPGSTSDVFFTATGAANLTTTLEQNFSINALYFNSTATGSVSINNGSGGPWTLTLGADGITVDSGSGAHTVNANVALGATQTWANNSSSLLTINGAISNAANTLTMAAAIRPSAAPSAAAPVD